MSLLRLAIKGISIPKIPLRITTAKYADYTKQIVGNREVVTFGVNGQPCYLDRVDLPFPAIRWKEINSDIEALKEKEKGDWRKLTLAEKKQLYRASFCQTFAEMRAPYPYWKSVIGWLLILVSVSLWISYLIRVVAYDPLPATFDEDRRRAQFRRAIDLEVNNIFGPFKDWDYENDHWK